MTTLQVYFAIGVPMFSILVVWLGTTLINARAIDGLSLRMENQVKGLNQRIDDLRSEMRAGFTTLNDRLTRLELRFDRIEDEVRKDHENRLARLEAKVFSQPA